MKMKFFLDLGFQKLLVPLELLGTLLFHAELRTEIGKMQIWKKRSHLIGKSRGINHSSLGLLLRQAGFAGHLVNIPDDTKMKTFDYEYRWTLLQFITGRMHST